MIIKYPDLWFKKNPNQTPLPLLMAIHFFKWEMLGINPCSLLEQLSGHLEVFNSSIAVPCALTGIVPSVKEGRKTRTLRKMLSVMLSFPLPEEKDIALTMVRPEQYCRQLCQPRLTGGKGLYCEALKSLGKLGLWNVNSKDIMKNCHFFTN